MLLHRQATGVQFGCEIDTHVPQMPRFVGVAGDVGLVGRVADDETESMGIVAHPCARCSGAELVVVRQVDLADVVASPVWCSLRPGSATRSAATCVP